MACVMTMLYFTLGLVLGTLSLVIMSGMMSDPMPKYGIRTRWNRSMSPQPRLKHEVHGAEPLGSTNVTVTPVSIKGRRPCESSACGVASFMREQALREMQLAHGHDRFCRCGMEGTTQCD